MPSTCTAFRCRVITRCLEKETPPPGPDWNHTRCLALRSVPGLPIVGVKPAAAQASKMPEATGPVSRADSRLLGGASTQVLPG